VKNIIEAGKLVDDHGDCGKRDNQSESERFHTRQDPPADHPRALPEHHPADAQGEGLRTPVPSGERQHLPPQVQPAEGRTSPAIR
jgi:hypothetical protein